MLFLQETFLKQIKNMRKIDKQLDTWQIKGRRGKFTKNWTLRAIKIKAISYRMMKTSKK